MGVAAEYRWKMKCRRDVDALARPVAFDLMDRLNELEKYPDAVMPFGPIVFKHDGKRWWALDHEKMFSGFGYWYPSLPEAVRRWCVMLTEYDEIKSQWLAVPVKLTQ